MKAADPAAAGSLSYVAGLEASERKGGPSLFKRFAAALRARPEEIVVD